MEHLAGVQLDMLSWVQLVDRTIAVQTTGGEQDTVSRAGLDNSYPYPNQIEQITSDAPEVSFPISVVGSPSVDFIASHGTYVMYLMFNAGTQGAIDVPLRKVTWRWIVSAFGTDAQPDNWVYGHISPMSNSLADEMTILHPEWQARVQNVPLPGQ
jgi:hypothetical protein